MTSKDAQYKALAQKIYAGQYLNDKVAGIKAVRSLTGGGLKQCKDFLDATHAGKIHLYTEILQCLHDIGSDGEVRAFHQHLLNRDDAPPGAVLTESWLIDKLCEGVRQTDNCIGFDCSGCPLSVGSNRAMGNQPLQKLLLQAVGAEEN